MAGHSKWAQIKRQKGVADARRGALFTKLAREITVAARQGGGDPDMNPRLRLAVERARDANMPMDNIERAIKRGVGETDAAALQEVTYEAYGPGGVAILIEALTDNRNRTVADIRSIFNKFGGSLAEAGAVTWLFDQRGVVVVGDVTPERAEELALLAIDAGAEDFRTQDGSLEVYADPSSLDAIRRALSEAGASVASAEISMVPKSMTQLDERQAEHLLKLLDRLDELDDVQRVHSNAEFPDAVLAAYSA
ncbi:MAG TPA: YebC/PmpR family DNA-binding transcriptional regulator [Dehalococcoidia bacterium]